MGEDEFEAWLIRDIRSWRGLLGDRKKSKINYADIDFYLVSADYLLFDPLAIQKNVDIVSK